MCENTYKQAYISLYKDHYKYLVDHSRKKFGKALAEDLVQEAFKKLWATLKKGKIIRDYLAYLLKTIKHIFIDHQRKKVQENKTLSTHRITKKMEQLRNIDSNPFEDTLEEIEKMSSLMTFIRVVDELDSEAKNIIKLRLEGKSNGEIATILDISPNKVKNGLQRAKHNLHDKLNKNAKCRNGETPWRKY